MKTNERRRRKRKRKKEPSQRRPVKEERKKKWSKVTADPNSGSLYVCLITKMSLKTELWKLKQLKCVFSFYNS